MVLFLFVLYLQVFSFPILSMYVVSSTVSLVPQFSKFFFHKNNFMKSKMIKYLISSCVVLNFTISPKVVLFI